MGTYQLILFDFNYFQDRNDFTPVFEKSAYTADRLLETVFPGTPVLTVKATDGDPEVSVRHVSGFPSGSFFRNHSDESLDLCFLIKRIL